MNAHASCSKSSWLPKNIVEYENKKVLDELAKEGTQMFHNKWAFISSNTGLDIMWLLSYMIL